MKKYKGNELYYNTIGIVVIIVMCIILLIWHPQVHVKHELVNKYGFVNFESTPVNFDKDNAELDSLLKVKEEIIKEKCKNKEDLCIDDFIILLDENNRSKYLSKKCNDCEHQKKRDLIILLSNKTLWLSGIIGIVIIAYGFFKNFFNRIFNPFKKKE